MIASIADAISNICKDLGLPVGDAYTQDWVYELSEEFRNYEYFSRYLAAYSTPGYETDEKRVLMQLMLDIVNDLIENDEALGRQAWDSLANIIRAESEIHQDQVEYWALLGEPIEDAFRLTPLARELLEQL